MGGLLLIRINVDPPSDKTQWSCLFPKDNDETAKKKSEKLKELLSDTWCDFVFIIRKYTQKQDKFNELSVHLLILEGECHIMFSLSERQMNLLVKDSMQPGGINTREEVRVLRVLGIDVDMLTKYGKLKINRDYISIADISHIFGRFIKYLEEELSAINLTCKIQSNRLTIRGVD